MHIGLKNTLAIIVIVVLWVASGPLRAATAPLEADVRTLTSQEYWQERIRMVGAEAAYQDLARIADNFDLNTEDRNRNISHRIAHAFGGALYREEGLLGYSVCDEQFFYACSHEFIGLALSELGPNIATELFDSCLTREGRYNSCLHSMGHGAVSYFGYNFEDLKQALTLCTTVAQQYSLNGCASGIFMEYYLRTMLGDPFQVRELQDENWYDPCDKLPDLYQESCAFSLPLWWEAMLNMQNLPKNKDIFARMGSLCDTLQLPQLIRCYEGVGKRAAMTSLYKPDLTATLCDDASPETQKRFWCKASSVYFLEFFGNMSKKEALLVCRDFTKDALEECARYADNDRPKQH